MGIVVVFNTGCVVSFVCSVTCDKGIVVSIGSSVIDVSGCTVVVLVGIYINILIVELGLNLKKMELH